MPNIGQYRYQKSIHLGRSLKRQLIKRLTTHRMTDEIELPLLQQTKNTIRNLNTSALPESSMLNHNQEIPEAPPLPSSLTGKTLSETITSSDFSRALKNYTSSVTPSGTDLSQSMLVRPSQLSEPPPIIQMAKPRMPTIGNVIVKNNSRNRRRTPITPDILALTKLRRPEHIKSSIAQRIEELKQASFQRNSNESTFEENIPIKPIHIENKDLLITCQLSGGESERNWLKEQAHSFTANQHLQFHDRLFAIRSIEFLNQPDLVRFHAQEQQPLNLVPRCLAQVSTVTILIMSALRLTESAFSSLSIPGLQIILNLIYVFILVTLAITLMTQQK